MTQAQRRGVVTAVAVGSLLSALVLCSWLLLRVDGLTTPSYTFQVSAIVQGPSKRASMRASVDPTLKLAKWIRSIGKSATPGASQAPALASDGTITRDWITIVHDTVASHNLANLNRLESLIKSESPWKVVDITRGNEFVQVPVRPGVTVLRLAEIVGVPDSNVHIRLQLSDPKVAFSVADALLLCLLLFVVFSFGATERNSSDVFAFPRGMHPVVIGAQLVTLALYACFMIESASHASPQLNPGLIAIDAAVTIGIGRWLWVSRASWSTGHVLRFARLGIAILSGLLSIAGIIAALA